MQYVVVRDTTISAGPGIVYRPVGDAPVGTIVEVIDQQNGWMRIEGGAPDRSYWIESRELSPVNGPPVGHGPILETTGDRPQRVQRDTSMRNIDLSWEGASGALQGLDVALRDLYKSAAAGNVDTTLAKLRQIGELAEESAPWAARASNKTRNLLRAATQGKLTPLGRVLSRWLEKDRSWQAIIEKYGDPFDYTKSPADRMATAERIIKGSGRSSRAMNGLQAFGKALLVLNVVVSAHQIAEGVKKQGTREAALGTVDIAEGTTNAILGVGSYTATKMGWLKAAGGGWGSVGASVLAAAGAVTLAFEETRRSVRGDRTMIVEATDFYTDLYDSGGRQGGISGGAKQAAAGLGLVITWPLAWLQSGGDIPERPQASGRRGL